MPKIVDPEARRRDVVDALFRVVVRDGLQRASLRAVAGEAGLNIGSVRHYFAGQRELMEFVMRAMLDRVTRRLLCGVEEIGDLGAYARAERLRLVAGLLSELLPLDGRRRAEVVVFLEFTLAARTDPAFAEIARQTAVGTRRLLRRVLVRLDESGTLPHGRDLGVEVERLAALLDGLGQAAVVHPDVLGPARCEEVLVTHLEELAGGGR
ncbi:TetR/AcrR family transcriptional regulator [Streptomyces sp. AV19]|uniref:TetR/AcrR family transcriptional regulator n=1 Tax=Streptomyces sp. AV19 TaxID=2793068 RepID=UPI0018FEA842|nr:TetR/AcrR family transcriptional regulator [Streptomyces sp. AV19]MBH1938371.1 TetR/AcrR family transcriptional regulator [Streptomyces sp. AV19]MDG4535020.1 TetR/AcrR family transcriptional regulator [Streptomyces sp. AV19]